MNKPFVVIDNPKIRITDLMNGTSEFLFKDTGKTMIFTDDEIRQAIQKEFSRKEVASIRHKVGATREYHE